MPCTSELVPQWHGFNAEDGAETALIKAHEEAYLFAVGDPSLSAVQDCWKNNGPVDLNLRLVLQAFDAQNTIAQPTK